MVALLYSFVLTTVCLFHTTTATTATTTNAANNETIEDFYSLSAIDISGNELQFEKYRGKVTLIVNVASECGYTDYNYHQLEELQNKYGSDRVIILGFPCNQFGFQEPGENPYIEAVVRSKYKITFPLFSKVEVTPDTTHGRGTTGQSPVYKYLIEASGKVPTWNFCKYLVNPEGKFVKYFSERESFDDIYKSIGHLLMSQTINDPKKRQHKEL